MATVSLCMIVKNEESVLGRCLDCIQDAVDEIIIVDTGSTDKTKSIAEKYTKNIFDFVWTDDFSAARNEAFSKATKDYIMWLDADDIITAENKTRLIELKDNLNGTDAVMLKYNTAFDEDGEPTFSYYRERLIRRASFISWRGAVHETIEYNGTAIYSTIAIHHKSIKTAYSTRNLDIYEKQLAKGLKLNPRDTFYYGRELYYHKRYRRAIEILSGFLLDDNGWFENKIEACKILSFCFLETADDNKAIDALTKSFSYDIPRAEICCLIGNIFMSKQQYSNAVFWFELALTIPKNERPGAFTDINYYGYIPCLQLCVCYDKLNDYKKAEDYNLKAGACRPHSSAYLQNLNYFQSLHTRGLL
ncbi:MAG: glycosyltransferase family 2 protein [Clostridium sp.]|nr:glycosyltransferase family 2 protein [Clostridium sp.]